MILPRDVKTQKKFRDAKIINDWLEGKTQEELALQHQISRIAIYQIIRKNREIIKLDKDTAKVQRVHYLKNALINSKPSEKDRLDILEALRKEYDGDNQINFINQFLQIEKPSDISQSNRLNEIQADKKTS